MKKIIALFLFLVFFIVAGCATMKKLDVQFSKKSTTIKIVVDEKNQDAELVKIFKSSLTEELLKKGFIVDSDSGHNNYIVIKLAINYENLFPVNGVVRAWVALYHNDKIVTSYGIAALTSILFNPGWVIKNKITPGHIKRITSFFKAGN